MLAGAAVWRQLLHQLHSDAALLLSEVSSLERCTVACQLCIDS
jgi:hypothetical protein